MSLNRLRRIGKALDLLEKRARELQQVRRQKDDRVAAVQRRRKEILENFFAAMPEDLWERAVTAIDENEFCPLARWLRYVFDGRSRLPECLTKDVMRRLVQIRLDEANKCDSLECVCLRCGLQYPLPKDLPWSQRGADYSPPHFFDQRGCPACGASTKAGEMNWAHLVEDGYWFKREPSRYAL